MALRGLSLVLIGLLVAACLHGCSAEGYLVGAGKADITGPVVDVNLMGYANAEQIAGGLHIRQYARAFMVADAKNASQRFVFVNMDACMASQAVTFTVIAKLKELYGGLYTEQNVALSGTHTHSGPAGYLQYVVYDITSLGFIPQTFNALVYGVVLAISRAHDSLQPGSLSLAKGELLEANINRSPTAYLENPEGERAAYKYNIDKEMTLLRVDDAEGRGVGAVSWFPVHCTSMNNTNRLVSGDNKGAAAQFMESWAKAHQAQQGVSGSSGGSSDSSSSDGNGSKPASGFVAAFAQANVGDTSPNIQGAFCRDTGLPCDAVHSTCEGRVQECIGRGPGWPDNFKSTQVIGQRQAEKAQELWAAAGGSSNAGAAEKGTEGGAQEVGEEEYSSRASGDILPSSGDILSLQLDGPVEFRHTFLDMRSIQVEASEHTREGRTCLPAMGMAFAAGTTDGPGAFDFVQSDTNGTAFWRLVRNFITKPTKEQEACHAPKPILLDVGEMHYPYEWVPYIVEIQILRAGQLVILCVPGEFTTMSGRRLRQAVYDTVKEAWGPDVQLVIAGLTNTYASYITTFEEYQVQRYEGGFTLFGPHTLDAYIQEFKALARAMINSDPVEEGPPPPNQLAKQWSLVPPVVADGVPSGKKFGDVSQDVGQASYAAGDSVTVVFHAGCPRNDIRAEGTFLTVERLDESSGSWEVVHTDDDWCTKFSWDRPGMLSTLSYANITWDIPAGSKPGTYRIRHFGDFKHFWGSVHPYEGTSSSFEVLESGGLSDWQRGWAALGRKAHAGGSWLLHSLEGLFS